MEHFRVALLTAVLAATDASNFTVQQFGGTSLFTDPPKYGIYCSSRSLLELAEPFMTYPPFRHVRDFRNAMEIWRTNAAQPAGRKPDDFVIYLGVGTELEILADVKSMSTTHDKVRVTNGPYKDRVCWTNFD
jgi:hypothetical protein